MNEPSFRGPVLLAHSYFLRHDPKQRRKMKPYPPLATLYAASYLRDQGHSVRLFDAMLANGIEDFSDRLRETRPAIVAFVEDNFNFLTKMCTVATREAAQTMIRTAKARGCRVAVNGSDATDHPECYLEAGADVVVLGEPEHTLRDLVAVWSRGADDAVDDIPGLALPASDPHGVAIRRTDTRPFLSDLDGLPFPAWDLIDADRYREKWTAAHGRLSWNVVTSRGCPYKCNWCAKPLFGTRYAQRSPRDVAEEFRQLRSSVRPDHVWFADDIFGLTARWIEEFAEEIAARDARIPFMMQSRANLMKPKVVEALADAGAEEVWMGVESGSQAILDAMDKGTTIEQIRHATRALKRAGIRACWFIQLGFLGEGWEEILLTRDLIRSEQPDDIGVSVSYPLPGTKFYEIVRQQLGEQTNWRDSDDLAMMFQGTYTTSFYRDIRTLLHDEVDARTGRNPLTARELDQRWNALEAAEGAFRSERAVPVVAS